MSDDEGGPAQQPTLGRYSLIRRIGKGGMGEVFLGKVSGAHGFEKAVAIKRILPQFSANPHVVNMLVDEARICVLLNHPNVVQVLELGDEQGDYFIVMEYVDGHALSRLLRALKNGKRRLDPLEACYIAIQLLEGLHAAHVQKDHRGKPAGIIHRDVSPQNILISMDGMVKVIDFGIARARERLEVTQGTSVKGKLRYMAPEQLSSKVIKGKSLDHRVDVFAAGILLFEMLAMRQRFNADSEPQIMEAILKEETPDLAREGLIDKELMDIVDTALEKNRDERFPDAATFAAKLRGYLYKREPGFTAERVARRMREAFGGASDNDTIDVDKRTRPTRSDPAAPVHADDDEQTKTAFRPATVERARGYDDEPGARQSPAFFDGGAPERRRRRSRAPAVFAGLLIGAGVLGGGYWWLDKQKPDREAAPDGGTGAVVVTGEIEIVLEAEPHTTRIALANKPDQRFVSPARIKGLTGDTLTLTFDADGYESQKHTVVVDASNPRFRVELVPLPVSLDVRVVPKDAAILVDGKPWDPGAKVIPGQPVTIHAEHAFAKPKDVTATPRAGETLVVNIILDAVTGPVGTRSTRGVLVLSSAPNGGEVFVDSRKLSGLTPMEIPLTPGPHRVTVKSGANERTFSVDVPVGARVRREVTFE